MNAFAIVYMLINSSASFDWVRLTSCDDLLRYWHKWLLLSLRQRHINKRLKHRAKVISKCSEIIIKALLQLNTTSINIVNSYFMLYNTYQVATCNINCFNGSYLSHSALSLSKEKFYAKFDQLLNSFTIKNVSHLIYPQGL